MPFLARELQETMRLKGFPDNFYKLEGKVDFFGVFMGDKLAHYKENEYGRLCSQSKAFISSW